jgi:hypothetical protein
MKENPLTMEVLLDQLTGLNIIQIAAIPLILLVILNGSSPLFKRILQQLRYHIHTFMGLVNVGISALLK